MTFLDHLIVGARAALASLSDAQRRDTYVVSLFVYDEDDDPRRPTVTVGTNTETQVRLASDPPSGFSKPNPWWTPTDEAEARWNYAFWQQDCLAVLADTGLDPIGARLREKWAMDSGLWSDGTDADAAESGAEEPDATATAAFVALCVDVARRLHDEGSIEMVFGRPIPVIVHELEYYDEIAEQNLRANPPDLVQGLVDWIRGG